MDIGDFIHLQGQALEALAKYRIVTNDPDFEARESEAREDVIRCALNLAELLHNQMEVGQEVSYGEITYLCLTSRLMYRTAAGQHQFWPASDDPPVPFQARLAFLEHAYYLIDHVNHNLWTSTAR